MTSSQLRHWLDDEIRNFPDRRSGEELYRYLVAITRDVASDARAELVDALEGWLRGESEPRTMLALDLAVEHGLTEMRAAIAALLDRIIAGVAFRPPLQRYYRQRVEEALRKL